MSSRGLGVTGLAVAACLTLGDVGQAAEPRWFQTADGVRLHYIEGGETNERTVVLVPGWAMPAWIWDAQVEALEGRYHVIALDPRGQGESEVPAFGYTHTRRGQDIAELIDHSGAERVVLVAWSLGVLDALAMVAARGDDQVAGLVLVDNSVGEEPAPRAGPRRADSEPVRGEERTRRRAAFVAGLFAHDPGTDYRARLTADALRMSPEQERQLLSYDVPREFWRQALHSTDRPVLYAVRARWRAQGDNLGRTHADARMEVFETAGHALFVDEPERFNGLLIDFLDHRAQWVDAA